MSILERVILIILLLVFMYSPTILALCGVIPGIVSIPAGLITGGIGGWLIVGLFLHDNNR